MSMRSVWEFGGLCLAAVLGLGAVKVIIGIVSRRIHRETPGRTVLESLVNRKNYELAGSREAACVQYAREIRRSPDYRFRTNLGFPSPGRCFQLARARVAGGFRNSHNKASSRKII